MTLAQGGQILGRGMIHPPRGVVDQKSPDQIGLTDQMSLAGCIYFVRYWENKLLNEKKIIFHRF